MERLGFPWVEVAADGSSVIGKHDGTGGQVSIGTVTSQLLYEIGGPRYLGPDVTARFDTIELEQVAADRVRIHGVKGEPPPPTLKVAMNELGGYRNDMAIALTGLDVEGKAKVVADAFWAACPYGPDDFASIVTRVVRTDKPDPATNEEATALWRISVKDPDERKVGRAFSDAVIETALGEHPGLLRRRRRAERGEAVRRLPTGTRRRRRRAAVRARRRSHAPDRARPRRPGPVAVRPADGPAADDRPTARPRRVRSAVSSAPARATRAATPTSGCSPAATRPGRGSTGSSPPSGWSSCCPRPSRFPIDRYRLPNIRSLNFVIHGLSEEGVAASTRQDAQAKSLGEWLRARVVDIPDGLLAD